MSGAQTANPARPLKAYTVHDGDECSVVVFAKTGVEARRVGAREMDIDFDGVESCRRFPAVDTYAPGPVPPLILIDHGWWFECSGCGRRVDDDGRSRSIAPRTRTKISR